jgi:sialate O-acetylesterase
MRLFDAKQVVSPREPKDDVEGRWEVCSPITAKQFSAVAYHFAREVQQEEDVPIGIIESSCSWTPAESWLSRDALAADPELKRDILKRWDEIEARYPQAKLEYAERIKSWEKEKESAEANGKEAPPQPKAPLDPGSIHRAAGLWNGSVAPFLPYAIRGVIWYQGETNDNRGYQYRKLFPALINDWRKKWRQPNLPFFWVQLSNVLPPDETPIESEWAEVREAQLMSLKLPHTGMAVTIDTGEENDVHPKNKKDVGHRLALAVLAKVYSKDIDYSGPIFKSLRFDKGEARVSFDHVNSGLVTPDNAPVKGFALAGDDRKYEFAQAKIEGDEIIVWNDELPEPVAVRYAWANNPVGANLYSRARNGELLPASPFRSDDWPGKSVGVTKLVSE